MNIGHVISSIHHIETGDEEAKLTTIDDQSFINLYRLTPSSSCNQPERSDGFSYRRRSWPRFAWLILWRLESVASEQGMMFAFGSPSFWYY